MQIYKLVSLTEKTKCLLCEVPWLMYEISRLLDELSYLPSSAILATETMAITNYFANFVCKF